MIWFICWHNDQNIVWLKINIDHKSYYLQKETGLRPIPTSTQISLGTCLSSVHSITLRISSCFFLFKSSDKQRGSAWICKNAVWILREHLRRDKSLQQQTASTCSARANPETLQRGGFFSLSLSLSMVVIRIVVLICYQDRGSKLRVKRYTFLIRFNDMLNDEV